MKKFWDWIKPKLVWIGLGAGAVLSVLVAILTFGRSQPRLGKPPKRPELDDIKDVEIPDVKTDLDTDFNDKPKDDFDKAKAKPNKHAKDDIDDLNKMFS